MKAEEMNDEGVVRLAEACIKQLADSYCARAEDDLPSYENWLRHFLSTRSWMRSMIDPEVIIDGMRRLRKERGV